MNTRSATGPAALATLIVAVLAAGCTTARAPTAAASNDAARAPTSTAAEPAVDGTRLVLATMKAGAGTEQGGSTDAFAYAEKAGDASVGKLAAADGVARVTGVIWPQKGSTWAGVGFTVGVGRAGKPVDASAYKTLTLQLAASTPGVLRIRVLGDEKAIRDAGCYPVVLQPVTPELREYSIPLARFASESYCGANARTIAVTQGALSAVEVADAKVGGGKRDVDFQVGRLALGR
ncbi:MULTISPECIES: hypothetical protein [unclassified Rhizobacter]|uniref:hypothetical protein n=1 Tax=unclassified Rhizobacter TaxID=2640088 RepID=UPI0006F60273|nr:MULTISPECIES: hypothetical protein [unclassified Rhizobacter]KQU75547.1 hypothetical protein ASC88_24565 [Rhizobacter sp. Root29]KQW06877.1 hypothetical protein ASC98_25900 [Rhizobacter sp. Root1238]KRB19003.1 hypothetical protein ASE08_07305 [Rhizobacter sp. Root16D2]